jgi:hypothetical protein
VSLAFLAPQFLWLLLALPLVVLLHFIRSRKKRLDVSALFLWRQAQEFARRRRRFSPTWLLFLQLLFVAAAALALAQPSLHLGGAPDRVLVMDASASMEAKDSQGLRLARAVSQAESLLAKSGRVAVVRAGLDATVLQPLTTDHAAAKRALTSLVAGDSDADLGRALQLAHSIAPGAEVYLFSDSAPPSDAKATWEPIEGDGRNLGISAFELRNGQAFVSVVSNDPRPEQLELSLTRDGTPVGRTTMLVPAKGQANASLSFDGKPGVYRADIDVPSWDALPLDNSAYALWRVLRVRLGSAAPVLARALRAVPNVEVSGSAGQGNYDVLVQVGAVPDKLKPGNYVFLEPAVKTPRPETISDWQRTDPLLRFVDLTGVTVGMDSKLPPLPDGLGDWQVLAQTSTLTPAIAQLKTGELNVIAFRFNPAQTDMVNRAAFPILAANLTDEFRGSGRLTMGSLLPSDTQVRLNGNITSLRRATTPGIYQFDGQRYAVSLLSAAESRLPTPTASAAQHQQASQGVSRQRQNVALWLVLLALVTLVLEWLLWSQGNRGWARG